MGELTIRGQCLGAHQPDARPSPCDETDPALDREEPATLELGDVDLLRHLQRWGSCL
jgi:hypothetical protein